ncbi:MAG TPA: ATP-binding protein [Pyrinomonadaceae bacterium]|nr:ATP-binding protein [Pyrinomonadaceae bacterium]
MERDEAGAAAAGAYGLGGDAYGRDDVTATLRAVAGTVRRILRADTASIASFSLADRTITWRATVGFQSVGPEAGEIVNPLRGEFAERAAAAEETIIEVRGLAGDLPASEFPLHSAEGVRDLVLAQLSARGQKLGVLAVGYRSPHRFDAEERQQLIGLSEMAALALDNVRLLETLSAAKRVWEQTFDAIPDGVIVHDDRMTIVRCNFAAAEAMGLSPAEVVGMSCADAFALLFGERAAAYHLKQHGGTQAATSFELQAEDGRRYLVSAAPIEGLGAGGWEARQGEVEETGGAETGETAEDPDLRAAEDSNRPPDAAGSPASPSSLSPFSPSPGSPSWSVVTWSDITSLAEVQEQLARSRRLAATGQLAAGVAHEINNPLAAITTCAEATLRDLRAQPEAARLARERGWDEYLEEIVRQALRCKEITRGLLDLSRQKRARREPVDLNRLVEQTARLYDRRAAERGVRVEAHPGPEIGEIGTDEAFVRQVLDNLLNNALDAVADGGLVRVSTAAEGGRVYVEVADDGCGIQPDTLSRVFDPFFTTKEPGRGSGLGLAVSLALAEALGGALTVASKPDAGTRFRLWLPKRAPEGRP